MTVGMHMATHFNNNLSRLAWKEARSKLMDANPELAAEIDQLDPSDDFPLYHVKYPYGELILDESVVTIPNEQGVYLPISDSSHPSIVREELGYSPAMPGAVVLKNKVECFCVIDGRLTPIFTVGPGKIMGFLAAINLKNAIDKNKIWNITAGMRSIFMLPPIGDNVSHNRLMRQYDLHVSAPKNLQEQFHVFKDIVSESESEWQVEMLFFSKQWCEKKDGSAWKVFRHYLYEMVWPVAKRESYFRFSELYLSQIQTNCNLRADPHLINTTNHLIHTINSLTPGYGVLTDDSGAPVKLLQEIYNTDYRQPYAPILMGPTYYHESDCIYYSLELPSSASATIRSRKRITRIEELREIRRTLKAMQKEILRNSLELEDMEMSILTSAKSVDFHYLHTEAETGEPILKADQAIELDGVLKAQLDEFELPFCENSRFFWGAILMKHLDSNQ